MRPYTSLLLLAFAAIPNLQAEEAEPWLTERDVQIDLSGLGVHVLLPTSDVSMCSPQAPGYEPVADLRCLHWSSVPSVDSSGTIYFTTGDLGLGLPPRPAIIWRTTPQGQTERVIHVDPRLSPSGVWLVSRFEGFVTDPLNGTLSVHLQNTCVPTQPTQLCRGLGTTAVLRITGLSLPKRHQKGEHD